MKKNLFKSLIVALSAVLISFSSGAQALMQGNFVVDTYYGFPNFGRSFSQSVEDANTGGNNFKAGGIGPAGLRLEYMIADRVGIGADVIYNSNIIKFSAVDSTYNGTTDTWSTQTNEYEYIMQRVRAQVRLNYHFDIASPDFDSYIGVGAGTNNRFRKTLENGVDISENDGLDNFTLLPFSMRIALGARYYFSQNIGVNMEIGLGGPVISAGLSVKL